MGYDLKTYDSNEVNITFAGRSIDSGRADGDFYSSEYNSETFIRKGGADGEQTRSKTNDRSATIKLKLMQTSDGHKLLTQLHAAALAATNGSDVAALEVRDLSGGLLERAAKAWIRKPPSNAYGKEAGEREWELECSHMIREVVA